jgi:hypothetical protein
LNFEGVPYSQTNIINGSYPLWGYEHYYNITANLQPQQQTVLDTLYQSVTNSAWQTSSLVFSNYFVPAPWLKVKRTADGGPIIPLPNY